MPRVDTDEFKALLNSKPKKGQKNFVNNAIDKTPISILPSASEAAKKIDLPIVSAEQKFYEGDRAKVKLTTKWPGRNVVTIDSSQGLKPVLLGYFVKIQDEDGLKSVMPVTDLEVYQCHCGYFFDPHSPERTQEHRSKHTLKPLSSLGVVPTEQGEWTERRLPQVASQHALNCMRVIDSAYEVLERIRLKLFMLRSDIEYDPESFRLEDLVELEDSLNDVYSWEPEDEDDDD